MSRLPKFSSFLALVAILLVAGVAAMPATLAEPSTPTVGPTSNAGELKATWSATAGAQFYVVGWANREEVSQMIAAGRDWLDAFHYATIPANHTGHTITGIKPDTEYAVIIGAKTTRFGGAEPAWSQWSFATTAGQHGAGFCPITGLPLPPGGYSSVGDTETFGVKPQSYVDVTLNSATTPASVQVADGSAYEAPSGLKLLRLCTTVVNGIGGGRDAYFRPGTHNNLSTDKGIGFSRVIGWRNVAIPDGYQRSGCDTWTIPQYATTAVYAIGYSKAGGAPGETLYRINLP